MGSILISMFESGKTTPVLKKSYEIAYALCRIAAKIPEKYFADALANEGVKLLGFAAEGESGNAQNSLAAAEYFIKLGMGIGSIDTANGELLLGEIAGLNGMIAGLLNISKAKPADLSGIFTPAEESALSVIPAQAEAHASNLNASFKTGSIGYPSPRTMTEGNADDRKTGSGNNPATESGNDDYFINNPAESGKESGNPAINEHESGNDSNYGIAELIKSGNRQGAILEIIRQSGNCRIKDVQDIFPGLSERTLRHDLQLLAEQNLIEKIGSGGPAVFYKRRG